LIQPLYSQKFNNTDGRKFLELTYNKYVSKENKDFALVDDRDLYNLTEEPNLPKMKNWTSQNLGPIAPLGLDGLVPKLHHLRQHIG